MYVVLFPLVAVENLLLHIWFLSAKDFCFIDELLNPSGVEVIAIC
jgi:hypothetical protein